LFHTFWSSGKNCIRFLRIGIGIQLKKEFVLENGSSPFVSWDSYANE
jgi:hypothetical protein